VEKTYELARINKSFAGFSFYCLCHKHEHLSNKYHAMRECVGGERVEKKNMKKKGVFAGEFECCVTI
jgi:hypothetical protein